MNISLGVFYSHHLDTNTSVFFYTQLTQTVKCFYSYLSKYLRTEYSVGIDTVLTLIMLRQANAAEPTPSSCRCGLRYRSGRGYSETFLLRPR